MSGEITYKKKERAITINPNKVCQPLGAIWATLGVERAIPFVQGGQGCTTYVRYTFNRHFREPVSVATASFHEHTAVYGGGKNIIEGLTNLLRRYDPALIAVTTTCSSETIGDDIVSFIKAARENIEKVISKEKSEIPIIPINCPSYQGSHVTGYDNASKAYMTTLSKKNPEIEPHAINIIPGFGTNPGDILEIKRILTMFEMKEGIDYNILFDISETLYQPLRDALKEIPNYPKGGTPIKAFVDAGNAKATFVICEHAGGSGAKYLKNAFKVEHISGMPLGLKGTDDFIMNIAKITGRKIPNELLNERGKLIDAISDTLHYTMDRTVGIFGDPDIVIAVARFCCEVGMKPVVVNTQTPSTTYKKQMSEIAKEYAVDIEVQQSDLWDFEKSVKEKGVDLLIGHPRGAPIAKDMAISLVRIGFPISDRVGHFRWPIMGYMGTMRFFDDIVNAILETHVPNYRQMQG